MIEVISGGHCPAEGFICRLTYTPRVRHPSPEQKMQKQRYRDILQFLLAERIITAVDREEIDDFGCPYAVKYYVVAPGYDNTSSSEQGNYVTNTTSG